MAKKSGILGHLYLIGLALVVVGCFLPFSSVLGGKGASAISAVSKGGVMAVGAVLALIGAAAGLALCFVPVSNARLLKLAAVVVSLAGGVFVVANVAGGTSGKLLKLAAKSGIANFSIGFYIIVLGWVLALVGWVLNRD